MYLDCDELLCLKFEDEELKYCVNSLKSGISSPDFTTDGVSVHELLQILTNVTHPCHFTPLPTKYQSKKKEKLGYFDQRMSEVAEELVENSVGLINLNIIPLLERILTEKKFRNSACILLWNLLHHENIKSKVFFNDQICEVLEEMRSSEEPDDQLSSHCSLWLLGKIVDKGMFYFMVITILEFCYHLMY